MTGACTTEFIHQELLVLLDEIAKEESRLHHPLSKEEKNEFVIAFVTDHEAELAQAALDRLPPEES